MGRAHASITAAARAPDAAKALPDPPLGRDRVRQRRPAGHRPGTVRRLVHRAMGRPVAVHVEHLPRSRQVGPRPVDAAGLDHRRPGAAAEAPQAAPGRCPAPRLSSCSPARTSASASATPWRMLYETAARSAEVLALDVEDLDLPNRRAQGSQRPDGHDDQIGCGGSAGTLAPARITTPTRCG